ncbi:unnamed protein product [Cuscuta europaea]|uniref:DRBM domain-containing protein n=1 Tax=Cuscuta europaea TaxID=41803 RepID=A0A9P1EF78_CUSEU|nr:unnamed protein product [Cuscuta europaea]
MDASGLVISRKEDVVETLLRLLVGPLLPVSHIPPGDPPIHKQQSVAKQLHAVVLLYNYYHRKQFPQEEHLDFEAFCKLAVTLRPVLAWHLNSKPPSNSEELDDREKNLSIVERSIQDACNLSLILDASKTNPVIEGWEISKVSVLLLDPDKENCFLMFGPVNEGVWSIPEKSIEIPTSDSKDVNKRKRIGGTLLKREPKTSESRLQQLAFLAVQDATGIKRADLTVLGKHIVYSLSKAKTTTCFYIMQCTKPTPNFIISLKGTIKSLQGPLVVKRSTWCFTTPVVEHFQLLPYATILSALHPGETAPISLQSSICKNTPYADENASLDMGDSNITMLGSTDNHNLVCEINKNQIGNENTSSKMGDTSTNMLDCLDNDCDNMVCEENGNCDSNTNCAKSSGNEAEVAEKVILSASKGNSSLQTALGVLSKENEALCNKKRCIEEKIALLDKSILEVLDGREDGLALEIQKNDSFCDEMCLKETHIQEVQHAHSIDLAYLHRVNSRTNEGVAPSLRPASQELDAICSTNGWRLPTYRLSSTHGGACVKIMIKGTSFECSCDGDQQSDSSEAKESAVAKLISRLGTISNRIDH